MTTALLEDVVKVMVAGVHEVPAALAALARR